METQTKNLALQYGVMLREQWWSIKEAIRAKTGKLPTDSFDFVSIHPYRFTGGFSLCSPMCLVESTGHRPQWEDWTFPTFQDAIRAAQWIAGQAWTDGHELAVVWCPDAA